MRALLNRLRYRLRRAARERDLDDELRLHFELKRDALLDDQADAATDGAAHAGGRAAAHAAAAADGRTAAAAQAAAEAARRAIGSPLRVREQVRDVWGWRLLDVLLQDLRYAVRTLRRRPGFTATVVLTLGLGIGATTAVFSIVNAMLLRPLPFADPDRLALVWASRPHPRELQAPVSLANFLDTQARSRGFSGMAARMPLIANISGAGEPEQVQEAIATHDLFDVLGVRPALGRTFLPAEDRQGTAPVAIISHALWQRRFGADPAGIYLVSLRTRDLAIHATLGATPRRVASLVLAPALVLTVSGIAIGLIAAWIAGRALTNLVYGIDPGNPVAYAIVASILLAVSAIATYGPARRALRIDPATALRGE